MNSMLLANGLTESQFSQGAEPSPNGEAAAWSAYSWIRALNATAVATLVPQNLND